MGQRWRTFEGLRFVFHPAENPFLSLLLKRAKYQPEPFLKPQIIALTFVGVASLLALIVIELLKVPLLLKGGWLLEALVISHLLAVSVYTSAVTKLLEQFWWEKNRHDLLLTGVPSIWLVLADKFCRIVFSAHFALLCLPFYAAAFAWGVSVTAILIPLALAIIGIPGIVWLAWLFWLLFAVHRLPVVMPFWANVPFLLTQPMGFFVWTVPTWLVVTVAFVSLIIVSVTARSWELEERLIPSQLRVLRWRDSFGLLLFVLIWGVAWAYLPVSYIAKVALSLCASRLLFSIVAISLGTSMKRYLDPTSHPMSAFLSVLAFDGIVLASCVFFGVAEGQGSIVFKVALVGFLLSVFHAVSHVLGFRGWQGLPMGSVTAILLALWFSSPATLLIGSYAPQFSWVGALAGVQGWLVPLSMAGTMKLPFTIAGSNQIVFPPWWLMATVQLAWSGLLFFVGRKTAPAVEVEAKPVALTADHPIFGWIVRLEDRMMERWDNALVNLQLRWQRRHFVGALRFAFALSLLGFVIAAVTLLTPLRVLLPKLLFATPIFLYTFAFQITMLALLGYEAKHTLWRWGQLRIMEQIVLTRLTTKQILFGLWFPQFWMAMKIFAIPLISAWLIALPQLFVLPTKLSLLLLTFMALATLVTPFFFFAASLYSSGAGLAGHDPSSCLTILLLVPLMPIIGLIQMVFQHGLNPLYAAILAFGLLSLLFALILAIPLLLLGFWYLRDVDKLKTARGYEEWFKRTEEITRKHARRG